MIKRKWYSIMLAAALWLAGCNGQNAVTPSATDDTIPVVIKDDQGKVNAEGTVEPARSVTLRAGSGGPITEVLAAEGERVTADAVLIRFDATDAELTIRQAEAALAAARAQFALAKAGARAEQIAVIEAQLGAANAALAQAVAQRDEQNAGADGADVIDAQAGLMEAELAHKQADEAHNDMMKCYDVTAPDGSKKEVCPTLGAYEEITRYQMEAAYAALLAAQAQFDAVQGAADPQRDAAQAAVQSALAQRDTVQAQLDLAKAGARAEAVAVAEAGVQRAEAALAQARAALDFTVIQAPFDGTVTDLPADAGDTASAGEPLVTLATLDQLQIKTKDLTELDVVHVAVGQAAVVMLDARPGRPLQGHVVRIDPQGNNYLGDVIYTVIVGLDAPAPAWLRWGMTAQVEISKTGAQEAGSPGPASEAASSAITSTAATIAEAAIEPERWSALRFVVDGKVAEVRVATGDQVAKGDVLVRLDATTAALAVRGAEADVATAQAQLALAKAGPRPEEIAAAEDKLKAAQGDLWRAVALREQLKAGGAEAELAGAQAQLEAAKAAYQQALITIGNSDDEDDRKRLNTLTLNVRAAEARVASLPAVSAARLRAANAGVQAAQAQVAIAQAELDLLKAPPIPEDIALAEAEIRQAEATLAVAQVALNRTELRAPFDGTVTQALVEVGETVGAGQTVLVLAALDRLHLTTSDLTELDVVQLSEGQSVKVTVDALPDQVFAGHIVRIKHQSTDYRGDVTYPLTVELDDVVPELRWGMRAMVEIPLP